MLVKVCSATSSLAATYCWPCIDIRIRQRTDESFVTHLDVIVDDFKQRSGTRSYVVDDLTESGVIESLGDTARIDSTHSVVRPVLRVTFNGTLHRDTTVEDEIDKRRDGKNVCNGGQG